MTQINQPPAWVSDAVFYQIFPDRFASSDRVVKPSNLEPWSAPPTQHGYKGGDLVGITEHLDYLTDLGINALYLNPVFMSGANHRYHTWDYLRVDPVLGGDAAFEELLTACHSRGIRVVLDAVLNHCGRGFYAFHDILENGPQSPWTDWFTIDDWPLNAYRGDTPNYSAWWGNPALPKFNTDHRPTAEYLLSVGEFWAERGIDGWRLDVPNEITTEGFWEEFRIRVRAINPDLYIVGEIWGDATEWVNDGTRFDATMNYDFGGATIAFTAGTRVRAELSQGVSYPVTPALDSGGYGQAIQGILSRYPAQVTRANLNLLGSHDTARVLSVAGDDVEAIILANLLNFTFPGAPCIYYGDEIGLRGGKDPESRAGFPWHRPEVWNIDLLEQHRELISLRHNHESLRSGEYEVISTADPNLYVFTRFTEQERLLIAVNKGELGSSTEIPELGGSDVTTLWGNGGIRSVGSSYRIALPPRSGAIWEISLDQP